MSLSTSLGVALTGLNAASTQTEIIANNVANALTPGYAAQSAELSSLVVEGQGAGVAVAGVTLAADPVTTASRRVSDAELGHAGYTSEAAVELALAVGTPDVEGSLAAFATEFEAALLAAANDPATEANLLNLADAAGDYADAINAAAGDVRTVRQQADKDIDRMVGEVNALLAGVEELNLRIQSTEAEGGDTSALVNERDRQIDALAEYMPLKTYPRENGAVALYTTGGGLLLDGQAVEFGFDPTPVIAPDMTLANGALSPLTVNGQPVAIGTGSGTNPYDGGALAAAFEVRDVTAPGVGAGLDALAADLIARFEDPAVDPTLAAGDAGLFTDAGAPLDPADTVGLSASLALNAAVDPAAGGEVWRLRDGINAAAPGNVGSTTILDNLYGAATRPVAPPAGAGIATAVTATGFAIELSGRQAARQLDAEETASFAASFNATLRESETSVTGVNTDAELQRLILVEQAYAANAQVINVIDELYEILLRSV